MNAAASVLIVDDEPTIRLMFRTALQSAGYDAVEAGDGPSALARLQESPPDVVLLDLKMPGMDGMETLRQMRERGDDTAVVIVTAHGSIADAVAAMKLGAVDFLTKPVTPDALRRVVREVVLRHNGPEPPSRRRSADAAPGHEALAQPPTLVVELAPPAVDLAPVKRALNQRDFARAERLLEAVLDQVPDSPEALTLMGVLHECLGQVHAAYHAYRTALECSPHHGPALENLKRYCEQFGLDFHSKAINPSAR
jgi:DNA-binding response OmpR family regulator